MNRKNAKISSLPPLGMRDFLPFEAELISKVATVLLEEFARWGYRRVITPSIDYLDIFLLSSKANELFKVADISSGEMLSFRSDFTPQIGRLSSAMRNSKSLPYKFSYFGPVLRNLDPIFGKHREALQAGVELIGPNSPESDAELIIMGIEALKKAGIKNFSVDIGNVEFFRGIVSDIDEQERKAIEEYTLKKDSSGLNAFLETLSIDDVKKDIIKELPFMFGEKSVIKKAWKMAHNDLAANALKTMEKVIDYIKSYGLEKHITIDLGEIRGLNYYTGTIFECFVPNTGYEIFGGGRYDNLIGSFGEKCAGAGFAVNMDIMTAQAKFRDLGKSRFIIINKTDDKKSEIEIIRFLREYGVDIETNFMDYGYIESLKYMSENDISNLIYIKTEYDEEEKKELSCILYSSVEFPSKQKSQKFKKFSELKSYFLLKMAGRKTF